MDRAARLQAGPDDPAHKKHWVPEGAAEYNIWYDRWIGDHWKQRDMGPAQTRCHVATDAGLTKANLLDKGVRPRRATCGARVSAGVLTGAAADDRATSATFASTLRAAAVSWARIATFTTASRRTKMRRPLTMCGCSCARAAHMRGLTAAPTVRRQSRDVFGRERYATQRDDRGGVGSFDSDCRSLFVGGLSVREGLENLLWEEFGEWGELVDVRIVPNKNIAFVTYKNRINAEFAKVAMADQQLGGGEMINVRWANTDPNPRMKEKLALDDRRTLIEAAAQRGKLSLLGDHSPSTALAPGAVTGQYPQLPYSSAAAAAAATPCPVGPMTREAIQLEEQRRREAEAFGRLEAILRSTESMRGGQ